MRKSGIRAFCIILAFLILGTACTAAITKGFTDWNPYGWFDKIKEPEKPDTPDEPGEKTEAVTDGEGNAMVSGKVYNLSSRMLFAATTAEDAETADGITVQATIEPFDADNKAVDWSVSFVNSESTWAKGKTVTDYVTVTPESDGSLTATVKCLKAFGEQINITVTSRDNSDATASCTADYYKKVLDVGYKILKGETEVDTLTITESGDDYTFCLGEVTYSDGTLNPESLGMEVMFMSLARTTSLRSYLASGGIRQTYLGSMVPLFSRNTLSINSSIRNISEKLLLASSPLTSSNIAKLRELLPEYTGDSFTFSWTYTTSNKETFDYENDPDYIYKDLFEKSISIPVLYELSVPVTGIILDNTSLKF